MLPCPGNIVRRHLAPPTTLPGHGSAFQQLPHRRCGCRGRRGLYLMSFLLFGGVADIWHVGVEDFVISAQEEKKPHKCCLQGIKDGMGAVGYYRGRQNGCLVVSRTSGRHPVLSPALRREKKPCKHCLQGLKDHMEVVVAFSVAIWWCHGRVRAGGS